MSVIKESYFFLLILAILTFLVFCLTLPSLIEFEFSDLDIVMFCLDLFTIAIPPSLPVLITMNTYLSMKRLTQSDIFCISPSTINMAGRVQTVVFDKTGTLTEDTLQVQGHQCVKKEQDGEGPKFNPITLASEEYRQKLDEDLIVAMAVCHTLTTYNDSKLAGDPLDIQMLEYIKSLIKVEYYKKKKHSDLDSYSQVHIPDASKPRNYLLRRFEFDSELQRMSVIIRQSNQNLEESYLAIVKGAPEVIEDMCLPSTVPPDFQDVLNEYTLSGFRVIAFG